MIYLRLLAIIEELIEEDEINQFDEVDFAELKKKVKERAKKEK
jgi:hypothetical protein